MKIEIELTDEQGAVIKDEIQGYAEALANDRIAQASEKIRADKVNQFKALPDEAKDKALAAAFSTVSKEEPLEG